MSLLSYFTKKKSVNYQTYFDIFEQLYLLSPPSFFWIVPFPGKPGRYIFTHFKEQFFTKYNGLELVIIDRKKMTYSRLPGAKPNGHGKVEVGTHFISINSMHETEVSYLQVKKINQLDVIIQQVLESPSSIQYQHLECRSIANDLFVPELIENILSGLEWHYRNAAINGVKPTDKLFQLISLITSKEIDFRIKMLAERIIAFVYHADDILVVT